MAELSESRVRGLVRLYNRGRIELEDIKDEDYKTEVENRISEQ